MERVRPGLTCCTESGVDPCHSSATHTHTHTHTHTYIYMTTPTENNIGVRDLGRQLLGAREVGLEGVNRSTGRIHTHTDREQHRRARHVCIYIYRYIYSLLRDR